MISFGINYTRPIDATLAGAVMAGEYFGRCFETAPDELTARFQFSQRFPTATIIDIKEIA